MTSPIEILPPITAEKPTPAIWVKVWFEQDKKQTLVWQGYLHLLPSVGDHIEPEALTGSSGEDIGYVDKLNWKTGIAGEKSYAWVDLFYKRKRKKLIKG